jgi:DNA-binding XRE family transcriptional regulator
MPQKRASKMARTNSYQWRSPSVDWKGEPALRIWREYRKLTQEQLAKKSKVSRALISAIETNRKFGSVSTWKKLGAALDVSWEQLA